MAYYKLAYKSQNFRPGKIKTLQTMEYVYTEMYTSVNP